MQWLVRQLGLSKIIDAFGGWEPILQLLLVQFITDNVDKGIDAVARMFTIPEKDVNGICHRLRIKKPDNVAKVLAAFRAFGLAAGNIIREIQAAKRDEGV